MQVVSIISTKGGVGKTTTAANLGGFAADAGLRVLLLDNDHRLSTGSRAICFAKRTLEIFDRLGVGQALVDALVLAFSGALLQAGMGVITYADLGERLDGVVATILEGNVA